MRVRSVAWRGVRSGLVGLVVGLVLVCAPGAGAAGVPTLYVSTSGSDANACSQTAPCASISHAVSVAPVGAVVDVGPGTFDENVTIGKSLTVNGSGAGTTTVYGNLAGSVFTVTGNTVALTHLTIGGGSTSQGGGGVNESQIALASPPSLTLDYDVIAFNSAASGGGVYSGSSDFPFTSDGGLTIDHTAIFANSATGGAVNGGGGGVADEGSYAHILNSAIYQNTASGRDDVAPNTGGGLLLLGTNDELANDTIAHNTAAGAGGGVLVYSSNAAELFGDTVADNTGNGGGGVAIEGPTFQDTIVAGNTGDDCDLRSPSTGDHNLEDDASDSCGFSAAQHDLVGVDPQLGPLQANGGATETMALSAGSPAVGAGNCTNVDAAVGSDIDQRGLRRNFKARRVCDIGAWDSGGALTGVVVETTSLLRAAVGAPYKQTLRAAGGTGIYTWSLTRGSLPAGLALSSSGVISGTPTAVGGASFTVTVTDSSAPPHIASAAFSLGVQSGTPPSVWVANDYEAAAYGYHVGTALSAGGVGELEPPLADGAPDGIVFDSVGDMYLSLPSVSTILEYAPGASTGSPPIGQISSNTGLFAPAGLAMDAAGYLYVADPAANDVLVYAPGAATYGTQPVRVVSVGMDRPWGVTVDSLGDLWVSNSGSNVLGEYAPGAGASSPPINEFAGAATGLSSPRGLVEDGAGDLVVANSGANDVLEFPAAGPYGDVPPSRSIGAAGGEFHAPMGVDVDAAGRLYVGDAGGIQEFLPGAVTPTASISGLFDTYALAVAPPLAITSSRLPDAALGRPYRQRLSSVLGRAPLHWRLVRGRLPRGLRLTRGGKLEGVPRQLGRFRFTVVVRDSTHPAMSDRRAITITVRRAPTLTAVQAAHGPERGGQRVTVRGSGFALGRGNTTITFGHMNAIGVVCRSHTRCTARTPPHARGTVRVSVSVDGLIGTRTVRYLYRRRS